MKSHQMDIVIDFDGTVVTHDYPEIGKDIGALPVLQELVRAGHQLILFTMRSGETLDHAVQWFATHKIPLYGVQRNPTQDGWTSSPKAYGQIIIDDAALGCPLTYPPNGKRPYADWTAIRALLVERGVLPS